nr:glycosyl hydrolase [Clostridiales bacterium]
GYEVYRSATPTGGFTLAKTTTSLTFIQTGLTRSRTYYFKVRAYRTVNGKKIVGAFSPVKSAAPG